MLTDAQNNRLGRLSKRAEAGKINGGGLDRLNKLRGMQQGAPTANAGTPQFGINGNPARNTKKAANKATKNIFNTFNSALGSNVNQDSFKPIDLNQLPTAPWGQDLASERERIEGSLYDKYTKNFDKDKTYERDQLSQQLAERGIAPGSGDLYDREMNRFDESWNSRYDSARQNAVETGGQEWQRAFGIGSAGRDQAFGEQLTNKQLPFNQLGGLMGLVGPGLSYKQGQQGLKFQEKQSELDRQHSTKLANMAIAGRGGRGAPQITYLPPPPPPPGA